LRTNQYGRLEFTDPHDARSNLKYAEKSILEFLENIVGLRGNDPRFIFIRTMLGDAFGASIRLINKQAKDKE
jgi:hypothetical protein